MQNTQRIIIIIIIITNSNLYGTMNPCLKAPTI